MWRRQKTFLCQLLPLRVVALAQASSPSSYYGSALEGRNGKSAPLQVFCHIRFPIPFPPVCLLMGLVQARGMVDKFRMRAKGGDGGNGCVSLRRSRSNLHGMPDGERPLPFVLPLLVFVIILYNALVKLALLLVLALHNRTPSFLFKLMIPFIMKINLQVPLYLFYPFEELLLLVNLLI
jgi:hypothetical protein